MELEKKYTERDIEDAYDKGIKDGEIKLTVNYLLNIIEKYNIWQENQDKLSTDPRAKAAEFLLSL